MGGSAFSEYFNQLGDSIVPWLMANGLRILLILIFAFFISKIVKRFIDRAIRIAVVADAHCSPESEKKREDTLIVIFAAASKVVIATIATLMILQELGVQIGPILAAAGIVGIAFGFGGQYLIKDLISGLFIILENQYRVGDFIEVASVNGIVENISLRMTTLRDLDGTVHHVPHGEITKVSNLSKGFSRVNLNIGVSYSTNLDQLIKVVNKVGQDMASDPIWKENILRAPQFLRVNAFADSSIEIKIVGDTKPIKQWEVTGELRRRLKEAFDKEGIEIPFPQRVVHQAK